MGRHSAPDDDSADAATTTTATLDLGPAVLDTRPGRHSHLADDAVATDDQRTQMIAPIDPDVEVDDTHVTDVLVPPEPSTDIVPLEEVPAKPKKVKREKPPKKVKPEKVAKAKAPAKPKKGRDGETDTQADLRVLRENSAVRARSIAGVLVAFLLYTVAMIVIGRTDVYLIWIWIPIVVSGVLVGLVLDLAHRPPKGEPPSEPADEPLG
jgi:hypothetical protein